MPAVAAVIRALLLLAAWALLLGTRPALASELPPFALQILTGTDTGPPPALGDYLLQEAGPSGSEYRLLWSPKEATGGSPVEIRLAPRPPDTPAFGLTPSFRVSFRSPQRQGPAGQATPAAVEQLAKAVTAAISLHDQGALRWPEPSSAAAALHQTQFRPELQVDRQLRWVTWLLLAGSLLALLWVLHAAVGQIHTLWQQHPSAGHWMVGILSLGTALRLAMPQRLVMAHMGHELLASARELAPPLKYGPAAQQWLHALDALGLGSWPAVVAFNQLCAALQLPIFAGLFLKLGVSGPATASGLAAVALAPVLLHDAASESILVPAMTLTLAAAWAWLDYLQSQRTLGLAAAFVLGWAAMLARPELLATVPMTLAAMAVLVRPWADRSQARLPLPPLAPAALLTGYLLWLRLEQMAATLQAEQAVGNTPRAFGDWTLARLLALAGEALWQKNGLFWPELLPIVLVPAWLLGLRAGRGSQRKVLIAVLLLTLAYLLPTPLDLPWLSVTRVQAPAMLWGLSAAGLGSWLWLEYRSQTNSAFPKRLGLVVGAAWLVSALATVPALWRKDLATQEEQALVHALAALPPGPARLLTRTHADAPDERVHLGFPDNLLAPGVRTGALSELMEGQASEPSAGMTYVWLGSRCQLRPCDRRGEHPACTAVRSRFALKPVWQARLRHEPFELRAAFAAGRNDTHFASRDLDFPWCVANREFEVGLYQVEH